MQDYEIQIKSVAYEKVFPSEYLEFSITATILKNLLKRIVNERTNERTKERKNFAEVTSFRERNIRSFHPRDEKLRNKVTAY